MRKFNKIADNKAEARKSTKEEKAIIKLDKKNKRLEQKEVKKEVKRVNKTTKDLLGFVDVTEDNIFKMKNGYMDIFQIESKDIGSFSDVETKMHIFNFISFLRGTVNDIKIISMQFPCNTLEQQEYIVNRLKETNNKVFINLLEEKLNQLKFIEEHKQNKEYYLMVFIEDESRKDETIRMISKNQNIAVKLINIDIEKKLKILFKLCNPNTKLIK